MNGCIVWICWKDIRHPAAGGAELVLQELSTRLVRDGWEVVHLVPGFKGCAPTEVIDGIRIVRLGRSIFSFYRLPFHFWRHWRRKAAFLVDAFICVGSFASLTMGKDRSAIVVYHIEDTKWFHQTTFYGVPRWLMPLINGCGYFVERVQLMLLARLHRGAVLTISDSTSGELQRLGFARDRIRLVNVGTSTRALASLADSLPKERAFTVLMIGPRKGKRPLHTLQAFELFQQHHPEAQFWVAGWGTEEAALRRHVEQHGIRNVSFWGRVPEAQRNELLQRAHVLCTSPLREGWGLVVTEANAMGTPVIGYDVPGLRDALAFRNGWLCACTPEKMAEKLEEVHRLWSADPAAYEALRQRCLESARAFTFDRSYEQFTGVLAERGIAANAPATGS